MGSMRCPKCGRFSKEIMISDIDGNRVVFSDCKFCGKILLDKKLMVEPHEVFKKTDYVKVVLTALVIALSGSTGFIYYQFYQGQLAMDALQTDYMTLHGSYLSLHNTSATLERFYQELEGYYDELQDMYATLRGEYSNLENMYSNVSMERALLQSEFDDVVGLRKSLVLEENRSLDLAAGENVTISYDIDYAGYLEINFSSTTDVYIWIGSSVSDGDYYSRYPPFPQTSTGGTFEVPVCATTYFFIKNTDDEAGASITLSIKYVY